jgi:hypothetical protein
MAHFGASLAGRCAMKDLKEAIHDYLTLRRSLGMRAGISTIVRVLKVAFARECQAFD